MKIRYKKRLVFLGLIFTVLFVINLFKAPVVIYLPFNLPDELKGTTIPPFGMFILEKYKGEKNPIDSNKTIEGKKRNRRVDFEFI